MHQVLGQDRFSRGAERPTKRNIKMMVHGNDFQPVADLDQIKWIEEQLKSEHVIKAEVLGARARFK